MRDIKEQLLHVKKYMRIDYGEDDDLIIGLMESAVDYLNNAGVMQSDTATYKLAINALCLHWYDNRGGLSGGFHEIPLGVRSIINQMKADQL